MNIIERAPPHRPGARLFFSLFPWVTSVRPHVTSQYHLCARHSGLSSIEGKKNLWQHLANHPVGDWAAVTRFCHKNLFDLLKSAGLSRLRPGHIGLCPKTWILACLHRLSLKSLYLKLKNKSFVVLSCLAILVQTDQVLYFFAKVWKKMTFSYSRHLIILQFPS